jgi:hypothetical protein
LFFPKASGEDKVLAYAVCGGIPQYLRTLAMHENIVDGLYECFLKKSGVLYEEPENFLKQELREPSVYNTLIASIAGGASKLNEISTKSGEESKKCSKYLKSLMDLHIIYKKYPFGVKAERSGIYALRDNMFRFWYRFIPQNVTNIESGLGRQVLENRIMHGLPAYVGRIFDDICREYLMRQNGKKSLPFMFDGIGQWWGTNQHTRSQEEIDILAASGEKAIFGECKWINEKVGPHVLSELKRKSMLFEQYSERTYVLFSKSGFSNTTISDAAKIGALMIDLNTLYE